MFFNNALALALISFATTFAATIPAEDPKLLSALKAFQARPCLKSCSGLSTMTKVQFASICADKGTKFFNQFQKCYQAKCSSDDQKLAASNILIGSITNLCVIESAYARVIVLATPK